MSEFLTGANGVIEAIKNHRGILYVSKDSKRVREITIIAQKKGVPIHEITTSEMDRLTESPDHRGFALKVDSSSSLLNTKINNLDDLFASRSSQSLIIILDGITDPGNLGAVIRAADQFSADAILVPKRNSAGGDADTLSRVSAGAIEWMSLITVTNISRCIEKLSQNGYWIWGVDMSGEPANSIDLTGHVALVMGREGEGLHRIVKQTCDGLVQIPTNGHIDSLNVAICAGIMMYEVRRQQGFEY